MKKYVILGLFVCLFSLFTVGCQDTSTTVDEQFIESMTSALEARWTISEDPS